MKSFQKKITQGLNLNIDSTIILKKSGGSIIVRILGFFLGLLIDSYIGRSLGPEGLGIFTLVIRTANILLVLSLLGLPKLIVKEVSISLEKKDYHSILAIVKFSLVRVTLAALLITVLSIIYSFFFSEQIFNLDNNYIVWIIFSLIIIPKAITKIIASGLIAFGKVWQSNFFENVIAFILIIICIGGSNLLGLENSLNQFGQIFAISYYFGLFLLLFYWQKIFPLKEKKVNAYKEKLGKATSFYFLSILAVISTNLDVLMVGTLVNSEMTGIYSVGFRLAMLNSFILVVINNATAPKISSMFEQGKLIELKKIIYQINTVLFFCGCISLAFFILIGKEVVLLWGSEFAESYIILVILSIGQFINMLTGNAGTILMMCNKEKLHLHLIIFIILIRVLMIFLGNELIGIIGIAIASTITVLIENIFKVYFTKKHIGILTIPFIKS